MYVCIFKVHLSREFKTREFDSQFAGSNEAAKECAIKTKVRSFTPLELWSCLKNFIVHTFEMHEIWVDENAWPFATLI